MRYEEHRPYIFLNERTGIGHVGIFANGLAWTACGLDPEFDRAYLVVKHDAPVTELTCKKCSDAIGRKQERWMGAVCKAILDAEPVPTEAELEALPRLFRVIEEEMPLVIREYYDHGPTRKGRKVRPKRPGRIMPYRIVEAGAFFSTREAARETYLDRLRRRVQTLEADLRSARSRLEEATRELGDDPVS
jgi:hypothetical protein